MGIEKTGQLYWTFEEIDFDGALEIVKAEKDLIRREQLFLLELKKDPTNKDYSLEINNRSIELYKKHTVLYEVTKNILDLKYWEVG